MPTAADIDELLARIEGLIGLAASFPQRRYQLNPPEADEGRYQELWRQVDEGLAALREAGFPLAHPNAHQTLRAIWAWCWVREGGAQERLARPQRLYADLTEQLNELREILQDGGDAPEEVFRELRESARRTNELFVIMAFREDMRVFWEGVVTPAAAAVDLQPVRIDEQDPEGAVSEAILSAIRRAALVLCDLSFERPNCYFEAGFAKGSFRRVLFTARADHDPRAVVRGPHRVHFDVDQLRITFWDPENLEAARREVQERLLGILRELRQ